MIDFAQAANKRNALALAKAGIPVFLTSAKTKRPIIPAWDRLDSAMSEQERESERRAFHDKHGFAPAHVGATTDRSKLRELFRSNGDALPAISCGPAGLIVIDNDIKERDGVARNGRELFDSFCEEHGGIPAGAIVVPSQGGGRHVYFANPEGRGCSAGRLKRDCESDVKGLGGYVIAPGSIRVHDGKRYGTSKHLEALIAAHSQNALSPIPEFIAKAIGERPDCESDAFSERTVQAGVAALRSADIPDANDLDIDVAQLAARFPKLQDAIESGNRSDIRFNLALALRTERPDATTEEYAAVLFNREDVGEFVEDERPSSDGGEYNWRNIVRDYNRAVPANAGSSDGSAFDAVDLDDEEPDGLAATQRQLAVAEADAVLDIEGADDRVALLKKQLKKQLSRKAKLEAGFLRARDHDDYQAPDDLVEDLIPAVGSTLLVGDSNSGKTFALLELVRCLGAGDKFLGRNVEQCGALLVSGEGKGGMGKRLAALRKRWPGADVDTHGDLPDFGENPKAAVSHLTSILDAHEEMCGRPVRLLALDNLTLMAGKLDPNKPETVNAILKPLSDFAHRRGISIVIAAHENRQGRENGSFAWKALCDNMLTLKTEKGIRTIGFKKAREGDTEATLRFKLDVIELGKNKWGNPYSSCVVAPHVVFEAVDGAADADEDDAKLVPPDTTADKVEATLRVIREKADRISEQGGEAVQSIRLTAGDIRAALNRDRGHSGLPPITEPAAVSRVLAELVARGEIVREGRNRAATYRLAD